MYETSCRDAGVKDANAASCPKPGTTVAAPLKIAWLSYTVFIKDTTLTIPAKSIDTNNMMRDKHLKNPDFFEVKKYPKIEFGVPNLPLILAILLYF